MNYHRLNPAAKQTIHAAGLSIAAYVRSQFPDGEWHGDRCGCFDDRCMDGYHHDPQEECGCLPVCIAEALAGAPTRITPTASEAALLAYVDALADELDPPNNDQPADVKLWPTHCWCGEPVQPSKALDHRCRQCAKHCEIAAHRAGLPSPRLDLA